MLDRGRVRSPARSGGGLLKVLLELGMQFLERPLQGLRPGSPPVARSTQVPQFSAKRPDPSLQLLVLCLPEVSASLEKTCEHPRGAAIRWRSLVTRFGT